MNKKKGFPTKMKVADDLNTLVLYKDANEMKSIRPGCIQS